MSYKVSKKISIFCDKEINPNTFNKRKQPIDINKTGINKIVISGKGSYGKKKVKKKNTFWIQK